MIDHLLQAWILVTNGLAFYWLARTDRWNRWGYVAALSAQPAYLYACTKAEQWGMLALTFFIIWQLGQGAYNRFGGTRGVA